MTELFKRSEAVDAIRTTSASGGGANNTALYAVADVVSGMCYNTGVMAFTPRLADMNGIFQLLLNAPKEAWLSRCTPQPHTDQEIITFYFQSLNRLEALPPGEREDMLVTQLAYGDHSLYSVVQTTTRSLGTTGMMIFNPVMVGS